MLMVWVLDVPCGVASGERKRAPVTAQISPLAMPGSYRVVLSTDLVNWDFFPESTTVTGCTTQGYLTEFSRSFPGASTAYGRLEYVRP